MTRFVRILKNKFILKHILIAAIIIVGALEGTMLALHLYTRHGNTFPVPDLNGSTVKEMKNVCDSLDLNYKIIDTVYIINKKRGVIVDQNPEPGFEVKKKRTIYVSYNSRNPKQVKMPDVEDYSFRQAKSIIERVGLRIGYISYKNDMAFNIVLEQKYKGDSIAPGTKLSRYSKVDLVLGDGNKPSYKAYIPDVIGDPYKTAKDQFLLAHCNIGKVNTDTTVKTYRDSLQAYVWRQYPQPDDQEIYRLGTSVNVWLTLNEEKIPKPDSVTNR